MSINQQFDLQSGEMVEGCGARMPDSVNTPTMNTTYYDPLPRSTKDFLRRIANVGTNVVRSYFGKDALRNRFRNKHFSKRLMKRLGWDEDDIGWEYFDILITTNNVALHRHMDYKNDSRPGYDHTFVYSFSGLVDGTEYKISVIMTTRCDVGSAVERIVKELK